MLVVVWRVACQYMVLHRNPLFWVAGVSLLAFVFDCMHTLHLGIMNLIAKYIIWELMSADAWETNASTRGVLHTLSTYKLRRELFNFYKLQRRMGPRRVFTEVSDLTPNMLGCHGKRELKIKAAACWGTFCFSVVDFGAPPNRSGGRRTYLAAANALIEHVTLMTRSRSKLNAESTQKMFDTMNPCTSALSSLNFHFTFKIHIWWHMVYVPMTSGNPWMGATWTDGNLNNVFKRAARGVHAMVFKKRSSYTMKILIRNLVGQYRGMADDMSWVVGNGMQEPHDHAA